MSTSAGWCSSLVHLFQSLRQLAVDLSRLLLLAAKSRSALAAENLFLRKQLALFQGRQVQPHRATDATRWLMVFLGKFFEWQLQPMWIVRLALRRPYTFVVMSIPPLGSSMEPVGQKAEEGRPGILSSARSSRQTGWIWEHSAPFG
jgi:hypothetical protein